MHIRHRIQRVIFVYMHETGTAISNTFRSFHSSLSTEGATRSASLCSVLLYRARAASHYLATRSSWRWFHSGRIVLQALLSTPLFTVQLLPWSERPTFQRLLVRCLIISSPSFLQLQKKKCLGGDQESVLLVWVCVREKEDLLLYLCGCLCGCRVEKKNSLSTGATSS